MDNLSEVLIEKIAKILLVFQEYKFYLELSSEERVFLNMFIKVKYLKNCTIKKLAFINYFKNLDLPNFLFF